MQMKRSSRASDTSSAYSGSDMMQSSIDDQENQDMDLTGMQEGYVDSDEEEDKLSNTEVDLTRSWHIHSTDWKWNLNQSRAE